MDVIYNDGYLFNISPQTQLDYELLSVPIPEKAEDLPHSLIDIILLCPVFKLIDSKITITYSLPEKCKTDVSTKINNAFQFLKNLFKTNDNL